MCFYLNKPSLYLNLMCLELSHTRHIYRAVIAQSVWRLGYGLDSRGFRVPFLAGAGNFSLHNRVQTGSGAHPASYPVGTRGCFPVGKSVRA
jgi:hypothetical protein